MLCREYYLAYMFALRDKDTGLASVVVLEGESRGQLPLVYIDILSHFATGNWMPSKAAYESALFVAAQRDHFLIVRTLLGLLKPEPAVVHTALLHAIECESASVLITLLHAKSCCLLDGLIYAQQCQKPHAARILLHAVWNQ